MVITEHFPNKTGLLLGERSESDPATNGLCDAATIARCGNCLKRCKPVLVSSLARLPSS
jgi:hypothetical protein